MILTLKYRIKDSSSLNKLATMAREVNFVWNYCNDTSIQYLDKRGKWLSGYDLCKLTAGCSKNLSINSQTIQAICQEYANRRYQFKKRKLAWRSLKRSLGWVPFNGQTIDVVNDSILYNKLKLRFWKSREIEGKIKSGRFTQDSKGNWYICLDCESYPIQKVIDNRAIGIDLGIKTIATTSDGQFINRENITSKYANKLAVAQRAKKKRRVKAINLKIKNSRLDFNHKQTTKLINSYGTIFIGDVSSSKLKKTRMAKSVSDASWSAFKSMLAYKAIALGVEYKEVKENFSTVTCSNCFERTGPRGLSALGVREWKCKCGATHNRDVNAAKNILRIGHNTLLKGTLLLMQEGGANESLP